MQDLRHAYNLATTAAAAGSPAAPALVNDLADIILSLPPGSAVAKMEFFPLACELAGVAMSVINRLNPPKPEKLWAGFGVYGH